MAEESRRKRSAANWLLWWRIDKDELARQVAEYDSLKLYKSARGAALGCILFSIAVTAAFVYFSLIDPAGLIDEALWVVLAVFIYVGDRWALIGAMIFWTIEKLFLIVGGLTAGRGSVLVIQLIWWCVFMHAFYFAFRVEQERKKSRAAAVT